MTPTRKPAPGAGSEPNVAMDAQLRMVRQTILDASSDCVAALDEAMVSLREADERIQFLEEQVARLKDAARASRQLISERDDEIDRLRAEIRLVSK